VVLQQLVEQDEIGEDTLWIHAAHPFTQSPPFGVIDGQAGVKESGNSISFDNPRIVRQAVHLNVISGEKDFPARCRHGGDLTGLQFVRGWHRSTPTRC
jgi:hypothetical protein